LAFVGVKEMGEEGVPYIWDSEFLFNIMPDNLHSSPYIRDFSWNSDGRLVFTVYGQLYLWDSRTAWSGQTAVNVSQNEEYNVYSPVWSTDGRLAFIASHEGDCAIFVWDGLSTEASLPNAPAFTNIVPDLTSCDAAPIWTPAGLLAYKSLVSGTAEYQIFAWDGQTVTNISQNPTTSYSLPSWRSDGYWAFESQELIYIRDADNHTVLTMEGIRPLWSLSGQYLAFLAPGDEWDLTILSIWDGEKAISLTQQAGVIWAQWQGASGSVLCCYRG
jgi:hypothetical protein